MSALPPWDKAVDARVLRQGGVAAVPALSRPRRIVLRDCPADRRLALCAILADAVNAAQPGCGAADQRYFTIEIRYEDRDEPLRFDVPETSAPHALVHLWREGTP
jgi:hypothetical protein